MSSVGELEADLDTQDIISVNLTRAVQLCVDVAAHLVAETNQPSPDTMAEAFDRLHSVGVLPGSLAKRLKGAVGFRNVAIRACRSIDWQIVHSITHDHLDDFREFARLVVGHLEGS